MFTRMSEIDRMFGAMDLLRNRMGKFFNEFDRSFDYDPDLAIATGFPRTNLYETDDKFEVKAEVPGISNEDLNVKIQGNYLEISGFRKTDRPEGYQVHRTERSTREFSRSFTLPADVNTEKVNATLKDGILKLILPKLESAKPRKITVS